MSAFRFAAAFSTGAAAPEVQTETVRPVSDVSNTGWAASSGGLLAATLDETVADDADYVSGSGDSARATVRLGTLSRTPLEDGTHTLAVRARRAGTFGRDLIVRLLSGGGEIAQRTALDLGTDWQDLSYALSTQERSAILDYTALDVELRQVRADLDLNATASSRGLRFGSAVNLSQVNTDTAYRDLLLAQADEFVAEYEWKWDQLQPTEGGFAWATIVGVGGGPKHMPTGYGRTEALGVNAAGSIGTNITPAGTAHTKGAWIALGTSAMAYTGLMILLTQCPAQAQGLTTPEPHWLFDVGFGTAGNEVALISNVPVIQGPWTFMNSPRQIALPVDLPAGTRIVARCQCNNTNTTYNYFRMAAYGLL